MLNKMFSAFENLISAQSFCGYNLKGQCHEKSVQTETVGS